MTLLMLSFALVAATFFVVRPAFASGARVPVLGTDGRAIVTVFPAFLIATLLVGIDFALGAMLALMVKELGHVIGYRLAGHDDARFRLVPVPGGPAISARAPDSDVAALFILLMGPGLGLAPMAAAVAFGDAIAGTSPVLAQTVRAYALAAGAVNFVALLPLLPLPGGRLLRLIVEARFPKIAGLTAAALSAFVIGAAVTAHSTLLLVLGLIGALALIHQSDSNRPARPRLTGRQIRLGFIAYFATIGAYFMSGAWVLKLVSLGF